MKRAFPATLLALLLLAGCGGPAAETDMPAPSPSATPVPAAPGPGQIAVNWDALGQGGETAAPNPPKRLSEERMDNLVPGDYGELYPYLGGEQWVRYSWVGPDGQRDGYTSWLYGLCTADGTLVTDPVYTSVSRLHTQDANGRSAGPLPAWVLRRTVPDPDSEDGWSNRAGLAAADGSWYVQPRYGALYTGYLAVCPHSVLMLEDAETAVLISLSDGSELARYTPDDFPHGNELDAFAFFYSCAELGLLRTCGDYILYDPNREYIDAGLDGCGPVWIDGATGEILAEAPMEIPPDDWDYTTYIEDGWYQRKWDDPGPLTLHYDDGTEEVIPLDNAPGELHWANRRHLLFGRSDGKMAVYTLTDHQLNVLYETGPNQELNLWGDQITGRQYPAAGTVTDPERWIYRYTLLDDGGEPLLASWVFPQPSGGLLPVADDASYRLVDLNDNAREVFRLPRFAAME